MDAERAIPSQCALPWLRTEHQYELGSEFRGWVDLLADDGVPDSCLDLCYLCYCMYSWLVMHLAYIPRDKRVEFGRNRSIAGRWLGCERKFKEGRGQGLAKAVALVRQISARGYNFSDLLPKQQIAPTLGTVNTITTTTNLKTVVSTPFFQKKNYDRE